MRLRKIHTEITIETDQVVVIRRRRVTRSWCTECGVETEFVPVEEVNRLLDDRINRGGVGAIGGSAHFAKARDGSPVICVKSLLGSS